MRIREGLNLEPLSAGLAPTLPLIEASYLPLDYDKAYIESLTGFEPAPLPPVGSALLF